jgi:hypothetical protein
MIDNADHCRVQSAECMNLMSLAENEAEARLLLMLSHSWLRVANQTDRYAQMKRAKAAGSPHDSANRSTTRN